MLDQLRVSFVDSLDEANKFLTWLSEDHPILAIDTETEGVSRDHKVRLIQFGDTREGWSIPWQWRGLAEQALSTYEGPVAFHNSKFDMFHLEAEGYPVPLWANVHDTMIMSRLKDPDLPAGLKPLCSRMFGGEAVAGQAMLKQGMHDNKWTWATVPVDYPPYWQYGALDTCLTAMAAVKLRPQVPMDTYEREMAVLAIMYRAEQRGMLIDVEYTEDLAARWQQELRPLALAIKSRGIENPNSDEQVTAALRAAGWDPEMYTDTGQPALTNEVLHAMPPKFQGFAADFERYRRLTKWNSTYLQRFLKDRDDEDRVHCEVDTLGARTGRMSIRRPALQTLPSGDATIRNCVLAEEGHELWAIDFSQIEMRMLAHFSGDPNLVAALEQEDLHRFCASLAYGVSPEEVTPLQRKAAKGTNFARLYGAGPDTIALSAGVPVEEIKAYIDGFDARFPGVPRFTDGVELEAKRRLASEGVPYVVTSGGRKVPGEPDKLYAMTNYLLQGSAADVFKAAVVAVDSIGLGDYVVVPVHDELLFSFPKGEGCYLAQQAKDAMEDLTNFRVPLTCEVTGPLSRWGDAYDEGDQ